MCGETFLLCAINVRLTCVCVMCANGMDSDFMRCSNTCSAGHLRVVLDMVFILLLSCCDWKRLGGNGLIVIERIENDMRLMNFIRAQHTIFGSFKCNHFFSWFFLQMNDALTRRVEIEIISRVWKVSNESFKINVNTICFTDRADLAYFVTFWYEIQNK